jgi:hypothetical protein
MIQISVAVENNIFNTGSNCLFGNELSNFLCLFDFVGFSTEPSFSATPRQPMCVRYYHQSIAHKSAVAPENSHPWAISRSLYNFPDPFFDAVSSLYFPILDSHLIMGILCFRPYDSLLIYLQFYQPYV